MTAGFMFFFGRHKVTGTRHKDVVYSLTMRVPKLRKVARLTTSNSVTIKHELGLTDEETVEFCRLLDEAVHESYCAEMALSDEMAECEDVDDSNDGSTKGVL